MMIHVSKLSADAVQCGIVLYRVWRVWLVGSGLLLLGGGARLLALALALALELELELASCIQLAKPRQNMA